MKTNICKNCGKEFNLNKVQELNYTKYNKLVQYCNEECGKELIKQYLETTNLKRELIAKELGISISTYETLAKKYNLKRTKEQIAKLKVQNMQTTMQEKYGITNAMEKKEFRQAISNTYNNQTKEEKQEKVKRIKKTKLEKYGDENYHNIEQAKQTMQEKYGVQIGYQTEKSVQNRIKSSMEKYGVDNPFKSNEVHKLARQKMKEKYGVEYGYKSKIIRNKINKSIKEKYGVDNIMHSSKYQRKVKQTMFDKYKVTSGFLTPNAIKSHKQGTISKINKKCAEELKQITNKQIKLEKPIFKYIYDIQLGENILIDINPTISHNVYISYPYLLKVVKDNIPVSKEYHLDRLKIAVENGYDLISVFDWDDWEKIKYLLQDKETLYARKLEIKEVDKKECNEFLNNYHLQNTCNGQEIRLGLYKNNELIEIMTFGKPRYNKNYEWELLRLCTKPEYKVVGGAEKLFKHFIELVNPKSIISYCDNSKFSGEVYTRLAFIQKGKPSPSLHWSKGSEHITDNLLRQRGFDQLFNTNYGKGTSNEELMIEHGWLPIYDCGQMTFIWHK